jgi:hypothetical protein
MFINHISKYLILVFLLFSLTSKSSTKDSTSILPKIAIKYNPTSRLDIATAAFQFAVEYNVSKKINLQHEIGYISKYAMLFQAYNPTENDFITGGVRFRSELRWYPFSAKNLRRVLYFAPDIMFKYYYDDSEKIYIRFDGAYKQQLHTRSEYYNYAAHFKTGFQFYPGKGRFLIDTYIGTGFQTIVVDDKDVPSDAVLEWSPTFFFDDLPFSAVAGIKIGYVFSGKIPGDIKNIDEPESNNSNFKGK